MANKTVLSDLKRTFSESVAAATYGGKVISDKVFANSSRLIKNINGLADGSVLGEEVAISTSMTHSSQSSPFVSNGTVIGLWHFDGSSVTEATDSSSNSNTLSLTDCTRGSGKWGNAIVLNGTSSQATATIAYSEPVSKFLAISMWINPDSVSGTRPLCVINDAVTLYIDAGILKATVTDGVTPETVVSELTVSASSWQNIVFQFNEGTVYLAVDDTVYFGSTTHTTIDVSGSLITIGSNGASYFDGNIDEILLSSNVLIVEDMPVFKSTGWCNDVAFWPFLENAGSTVYGTNVLMPSLSVSGGTWVAGRNNYAIQFDGVSQYAEADMASETFSDKKLSICVCVRFDADSACPIISQANGINIEYTGTHIRANIYGVTAGDTDIAKIDVNTSDWYIISVQYDGTYKSCYVNGQKIGSIAASGTPVMSTSMLNIAKDVSGTQFGECTIDFVRIYRNELFPYVRPIRYCCAGQDGFSQGEEWVVG